MELTSLIETPEWKRELYRLVREEDFDPWAIDIVRLADAYLSYIRSREDFKVSGRAVLICSVLLRWKARFLEEEEEEEPQSEPEIVEERTQVNLEVPRITSRRVTLEELISALEEVMEKTQRGRRKVSRNKRAVRRAEVNLEREKIEEKMERLRKLLKGKEEITLSELTSSVPFHDVFLPLLFLAHRGEVSLLQSEPFGEVVIRTR